MKIAGSQPFSVADGITSPWPHRLAVALACATFPLIWVGGLVTTTKAGMAVPDWPTTFGYNMFLYPWQSWLAAPWDLFIEHGHRLLGAAVGFLTLSLAAICWWRKAPRSVRWLSLAAIAGVMLQGLLGGLRVVLDSRLIGQLHGTVGPLYFVVTVALATVTAGRFSQRRALPDTPLLASVRRLAFFSACLAWLQLGLGARLRHIPAGGSPQEFQTVVAFHLFFALVLCGHIILLLARVLRLAPETPGILFPAAVLAALMAWQIVLGGWTWIERHGWPSWLADSTWSESHVIVSGGWRQSLVVTGHVATGSLIFATAALVWLRSLRQAESPSRIQVRVTPRREELLA